MNTLSCFGAAVRGVAAGRLDARDLRALAAVVAFEGAALAGITLGTIPGTRRRLARARRVARLILGPGAQARLLWALDAGARRGVGTCLTRALAAEALLPSSIRPALVIGIAPTPGAPGLDAHAWVSVGGRTIVGKNAVMSRYRPFAIWQDGRP